jgi:ABC-type glycerol-3-phosphate transport system permease component
MSGVALAPPPGKAAGKRLYLPRAQTPLWQRDRRRSVTLVKGLVLALAVFAILFPLYNIVMMSLMNQQELTQYTGSFDLFPHTLTLNAYRAVLGGGIVTHALLVSFAITLVGTAASLAVSVALAFGLSVQTLPFRRTFLTFVLLTFLFTPGIIPLYLTVDYAHMLNTYESLIVPVLLSTFNVIVIRNFFMNFPNELLEAATVDGCGYGRLLVKIVLPLSKPVLAVMALFYAVAYWDSFFNALLYLNDSAKWPIQLVLQQYVIASSNLATGGANGMFNVHPPPEQSVQMAAVVIATVPILLVYPFLQRYFVRGVLTGAVKG